MKTLTLTIVSDVINENQVFDHLVKVRRHDTKEEGLLLCSHCCNWPKHLIEKATWLEGCYTPEAYKDDTRLLMGYHPNEVTNWSVDVASKTITLSVQNTYSPVVDGEMLDDTIEVDFYNPEYPVEWHEMYIKYGGSHQIVEHYVSRLPRWNLLNRLFQRAMIGRTEGAGLSAYYRMVDQTFLQGDYRDWNIAIFIAHQVVLQHNNLERVWFLRESPLREMVVTSHCEVYSNALIVVRDGHGYEKACPLPTN